MYTPAGKIEPIPGTAYGVMPVKLHDEGKEPVGYVLTMDVTYTNYITLNGLYLSPLRALKEAVTLTEIEMRRNDPESK